MSKKKKFLDELTDDQLNKMYEEYRDSLPGGPNRPRGMSEDEYDELMKSKTKRIQIQNKKFMKS
jgi:hypothetical protein